jgi:hypothetical protein
MRPQPRTLPNWYDADEVDRLRRYARIKASSLHLDDPVLVEISTQLAGGEAGPRDLLTGPEYRDALMHAAEETIRRWTAFTPRERAQAERDARDDVRDTLDSA